VNAALWSAIPSTIAILITAGAALASQRAAAKASVKNAEVTSRTSIETLAFERAKSYYTDTIDRQVRDISDLEGDVATLKQQAGVQAQEIRDLRSELDIAKRALRRAFPDEA
jgi:hypothetical protein